MTLDFLRVKDETLDLLFTSGQIALAAYGRQKVQLASDVLAHWEGTVALNILRSVPREYFWGGALQADVEADLAFATMCYKMGALLVKMGCVDDGQEWGALYPLANA